MLVCTVDFLCEYINVTLKIAINRQKVNFIIIINYYSVRVGLAYSIAYACIVYEMCSGSAPFTL